MLRYLLLLILLLLLDPALSRSRGVIDSGVLHKLRHASLPQLFSAQKLPSQPSLAVAAIFAGALALLSPTHDAYTQEEVLAAWRDTDEALLPHQSAVLYLHPHAPQLRDFFGMEHIAPLAYLGIERAGDPLFLAIRLTTFAADQPLGLALHKAGFSLFSSIDMIAAQVAVEEKQVFPAPIETPAGAFDIVFVTLPHIDPPEDLQPIQLGAFPPPDTELQLLSYWPRGEGEAFNLRQRDCQADKLNPRTQIAGHGCVSPFATLSFGAPIFNTTTEPPQLVGFYLYSDREADEAEAVAFSSAVLEHAATALVSDNSKNALLGWAALKR